MGSICNCHIHIFTSEDVPDGFLPLGLMRMLRRGTAAKVADAIMSRLPSGSGRWERTAAFARTGRRSSAEIFADIRAQYPRGTKFVVLPMDMEYMGAGRSPRGYLEQLEALRQLHAAHRDVLIPFIAVDPRRVGIRDLVREYVEDHGFRGIKLYPALGFWPTDDRLQPVYEYAQAANIPVMTHCSRGGVYYRGPITDRTHPVTRVRIGGGNDRFCEAYSEPMNFATVLRDYPRLRICLAHWGGGDEWHAYLKRPWPRPDGEKSWLGEIIDMIGQVDNLYTDISYTASNRDFLPFMKILCSQPRLQDRVLFGSDWYMVQRDATEREFSINLRATIGEEAWQRIAVANPLTYLGVGAAAAPATGMPVPR
jgi:predicted TIM-barrel fold metal-dependent hydrolase